MEIDGKVKLLIIFKELLWYFIWRGIWKKKQRKKSG